MTRNAALASFIERMPFARKIGFTCAFHGDEMTATMPYADALVGNASLPALHGGAIGSLLELTAMAQVYLHTQSPLMPRTINVTVDYLRSAGPADVYARATLRRLGRRIVSVHAEAWQGERERLVATLRASMMIAQPLADEG